MVLKTKCMNAEPSVNDGLRICVMRDSRIYNRHLALFQEKFKRPMYDMQLKSLAPPTWLKDDYQNGRISWKEYVKNFNLVVLDDKFDLIQAIAFAAKYSDITLLCSEKTPEQCHRRLLAEDCKKYEPNLEVIIE